MDLSLVFWTNMVGDVGMDITNDLFVHLKRRKMLREMWHGIFPVYEEKPQASVHEFHLQQSHLVYGLKTNKHILNLNV